MDDAERASRYSERMLDARLANRVRYQGTSATHCDECGDAIPERRRASIAGTRHCAECRDWLDRRGLA